MHLTLEQYLEIERKTKELEKQINALKKWIKYWSDVDIDMDNLMEWEKEHKEEEQQTMTPEEIQSYIKRIEMYSDVFNYGRVESEGKKMAESL
jgi:methionyl-tRNA formyltransferase